MAKGKRASLKDKDPDSLGLTQKKGKGIDLLFGGPSSAQEADTTEQSVSETGSENDLTGLVEDSAAVDTSLSGITTPDDRLVDELGLPVALEEPPDDLILASSSPAESLSATGGEDAVDPSMSPFALPTAEGLEGSDAAADVNDLSGILVEDVSPIAEEENLSSSLQENDLSGIVDDSTSPDTVPGADLSDMIVEDSADDLSGMGPTSPDVASTAPAGDLSGLTSDMGEPPATPPPATFPPSTPPPTTAAPINVPPSTTPQAGTTSTTTPPVTVDNFAGVVTGTTPVSEEDILPEDASLERGDHTLAVDRRSQLEPDEAVTEKVMRYIGRERRERLDHQIESLYDRVADELSSNKTDAEFALNTLQEAHDIMLEKPYEYDEALYRVAVVKTMLVRKRNLRRWSYSWGMVVFLYAIVWLVVFIAGFSIDLGAMADPDTLSEAALAIRSAWVSALAGGLGSIIAILYSLSWRVAYKHEFDRQYIMKYLVQPFMGFLLGAVIFFITSAGFLVLGGSSATPGSQYLGGDQLIIVQILLGIIAGFRQRAVYYMIDRIVKRISPKATETKGPSSVVPTDDYARLQEAEESSSP